MAALGTLATYLSYLAFTRAGYCAGGRVVQRGGWAGGREVSSAGVAPDLLLCCRGTAGLRTHLPCITRPAPPRPALPPQPPTPMPAAAWAPPRTTAATRWMRRRRWRRRRRAARAWCWRARCPGYCGTSGFSSGIRRPRQRRTSGKEPPGGGVCAPRAAGCSQGPAAGACGTPPAWLQPLDSRSAARTARLLIRLTTLLPPPRGLLARLARLHAAPELRPAQPAYGLTALCLRSALDDFAERMGPDLMPTAALALERAASDGCTGEGGAAAGTSAADGPACAAAASGAAAAAAAAAPPTCPALGGLAGVDGLLDSRYLGLCCPTLDHARQLFSASAPGSRGPGEQARRVKKIRPTAPSGAAAARAALGAGGPGATGAAGSAAAPADTARDVLRLQLQRAFLDQYSTDEHKVGVQARACRSQRLSQGGRLCRGGGARRPPRLRLWWDSSPSALTC